MYIYMEALVYCLEYSRWYYACGYVYRYVHVWIEIKIRKYSGGARRIALIEEW